MTSATIPIANNLDSGFLPALFEAAEHSVFLTTLTNARGDRGYHHERVCAANESAIRENSARVIEKYDRAGQASYFCVSTLDPEKVEAARLREKQAGRKEPSARAKENLAELLTGFADIDLKNYTIGRTIALSRLAEMRCPPSVAIDSGNGLHVYWLLKEAIEATPDAIADFENLLHLIVHVVGGDAACVDASRLMRTPGSHNSKNGAWKEVHVIETHSDLERRYEFEELVEFFRDEATPIFALEEKIKGKTAAGKEYNLADGAPPAEDNAWTAYIREQVAAGNIRLPPLDVDKMLACMAPGDAEYGVHNVSRSVTASLVARGWSKDDIIPMVMGGIDAMVNRQGIPQGWRADWHVAEEKKIIGQIDGALKKQNPEKLERARQRRAAEKRAENQPRLTLVANASEEPPPFEMQQAAGAETSSNVFQINRVKKTSELSEIPDRSSRKKKKGEGPSEHAQLAGMAIARLQRRDQQICFWNDELWIFEGGGERGTGATADSPHTGAQAGLWHSYAGSDANNWLETLIHETVDSANEEVRRLAEELDGDPREVRDVFPDDSRLRSEARKYLRTMPVLHYRGEWDAHGLTPLANGLFDPATKALTPYTPEARATYRFAAGFDAAGTFVNGKQMIADLFEPYGEEAAKYSWMIQQFCYVAIFKTGKRIGRQLRRCLYLLGEQDSGKSQMLDLLRSVIGPEFSDSTTLDAISDPSEGRFAVQTLLNEKILWAADEAAGERTKINAPRLKALLAEDIVKTDNKGVKATEKRFLGSTIFSSNSFPQTLDKASGFADRFMLVRCPAAFDKDNPRGVALLARQAGFSDPSVFIEATELPGFLNWALEARDWIEKNHRFEQPAAVVGIREEIADAANPLRVFARECLESCDLDIYTKSIDVYEAYREWHAEDDGDKECCVKPKKFWSIVNAQFTGKRGSLPRGIVKIDHGTIACGVRLGEQGVSFWKAAMARQSAGDKKISSSISSSVVDLESSLDPEHAAKVRKYFGASAGPTEPAKSDKRPRF